MTIETLHALYCAETSRNVPCSMERRFAWEVLLVAIRHYDCSEEQAVRLVARRLMRLTKGFRHWEHRLDFRKFVEPENFCEQLAAALAEERKPKAQPAVKVVEQFTGRRYEPPASEAVSAETALQRTKLAAELAKWKREHL